MYFLFSELEFRAMPLGHSGILILWDPPTPEEARYYKYMKVDYHATGENPFEEKSYFSKAEELDMGESNYYSESNKFDIKVGHYKLNSLRNELLKEDTSYEITLSAGYFDEPK